ncbi:MAG: hypothetical protein IJJ71_02315 [Treponema sp.]|uniref:hypothetical protein n=1 Tax=Treponema sp. TaxID=166 RepID=UPI0025EF0B0E|nr:hypothetical protein [Treponema sp.]MBR0494993.1 hypothetical protein [Treponema sp.]
MIRLTIITGLLAMRAGKHLLTITLLLISPYIFPQEKNMNLDENISEKFYTQEVKGQIEIQIKNRDFFLGLKPWKDGKLVTVDGWGQFSSFEITEKNKIKIKPLVKFPKSYVDPYKLETVPDKGIITSSFRGNQVYLADINEKRTKELIPFLTFKYHSVHIFPAKDGIFYFPFTNGDKDKNRLVIYSLYEDKILLDFEDQEDSSIYLADFFPELNLFLGREGPLPLVNYFFYNLSTHEKTKNKLTDYLNLTNSGYVLNIKKIGENVFLDEINNKILKFNDDYSEKDETILQPFLSKEKKYMSKCVSEKREWVSGIFGGITGVMGEKLYKLGFNCIKNGVSVTVLSEEYFPSSVYSEDQGFLEPPVYGTIYVIRVKKKDKEFLRLYKMSDIQAEIDKLQRGEGR